MQVTVAAHDAVNTFCKLRDHSQVEVIEEMILWFTVQPACVQSVILAKIDAGLEVPYAKILRKLAADVEGGKATMPSRLEHQVIIEQDDGQPSQEEKATRAAAKNGKPPKYRPPSRPAKHG